ncbi:MAG: sulfite exporter TauE/SafE family protein [Woeseiaceae bacterium]|nr:sulfite exporter TauE/SafE family protein [Woeseiaceae bacterium]
MISDPLFYAVAIPAVLLFGISKGGFGGGLGVMAVPLMALVISPIQAAAILLPILCFMDILSVRVYWKRWSWADLRLMLPASVVGILVGTATFQYLDESLIKLIVGVVAASFAAYHYLGHRISPGSGQLGPGIGLIASSIAGFTSFVAHAGGPPVNMFLLKRSLDKTTFVATTVFFFAAVNFLKLIPYGLLGQLDTDNLKISATLFIPAAVGVLTGAWLHSRVSDRYFYEVVYALLLIVGLKLTYDGLAG